MREELVNEFEEIMRADEKSENTVKTYIKWVNEYFDYLEEKGLEYNNVKPKDLKLFRNSNPNLSLATKNLKLSAVSSFYSFIVNDMRLMDYNPCSSIKSLDIKNREEQKPLNKTQIHWLINSCKNIRDKCIVELLVTTGLRISELIDITLDDYIHAKNQDGELSILGKGNKIRKVYINDTLINDIDKYLKIRKNSEYDNLFISNSKTPMTQGTLSRTLKVIARRSGHFTEEEIKRLHNHTLRHSFCTNAIESNVPIEVVSKVMGHSNTNVTYNIYLHQSKDRIKSQMQELNLI